MKIQGVTLVELLIALAICGILAALSGVAFQTQQDNQRRDAMKTALVHLQAEQANRLLLTNSYSTSLHIHADSRFSLTVISADKSHYIIKAKSNLARGHECDELVVTNMARTPAQCWN